MSQAIMIVIFAVALALRLLQIWGPEQELLRPDSGDYLRLAAGLGAGHYGEGEIFRTPGYPVWLWLCQGLGLGIKGIAGLQALLDCGTVALVMGMARRHLGLEPLAAGWLAALNVSLAAFAVTMLSEGPFTCLLTAATALLLELLRTTQRRRELLLALAVGLLLAAALYLRAALSLYLILPLALLLWRRRFVALVLLSGVILVSVAPWVWRNHGVAGYQGFSSVSEVNLYRYNAAALLARQQGRAFSDLQLEMDRRFPDGNDRRQLSEGKALALEALKGAPLQYAAVHLRSSVRSFLPAMGDYLQNCGLSQGGTGTLAVVESQGWVAGIRHYCGGSALVAGMLFIALLGGGALYLLAGCGLWLGCKDAKQRELWVFFALSAAYFLLVAGPAAHPRFGVPAQPFLILLASLALNSWWRQWQGPPRAECS